MTQRYKLEELIKHFQRGLLETIGVDGKIVKETTLSEIRDRIKG